MKVRRFPIAPRGALPEHSATYTYDELNRLESVSGGDSSWGISWGLDRYGNRTSQTPTGLAVGRVGSPSIAYNSQNRNMAWTYDAAGNVTNDNVKTYTYDAESRLIQVGNTSILYAYDAAGRRIRKTIGSESTYYLYGLVGLMSEFTTVDTGATAAASDDRLQYRVAEQTGTPVMLVDANGIARENNRVFPFGEPWSLPVASANDQNFTTYQRDEESGLDYAMARYYASRGGRFMTPDPGHIGANVGDPQSWNAYVYGLSDPINLLDPTGTTPECPDQEELEAQGLTCDYWRNLLELRLFGLRNPVDRLARVVDQIGQGVRMVMETVANFPPPDPTCMAKAVGGSMVLGAGMGTTAGAAGFTLGPVGVLTTHGGTALGGGSGALIGGAVGSVTCRFMSSTGSGGGGNQPPLRNIHSAETLQTSSLEFWRKKSTQEIVESLKPGMREALRVKRDGTVMNGNTRIKILMERGFNVNSLPREILD